MDGRPPHYEMGLDPLRRHDHLSGEQVREILLFHCVSYPGRRGKCGRNGQRHLHGRLEQYVAPPPIHFVRIPRKNYAAHFHQPMEREISGKRENGEIPLSLDELTEVISSLDASEQTIAILGSLLAKMRPENCWSAIVPAGEIMSSLPSFSCPALSPWAVRIFLTCNLSKCVLI